MIAWAAPPNGKTPNRDYFIGVIAASIGRRHPDLANRDIEHEINRLAESDSEIQAILAERTEFDLES